MEQTIFVGKKESPKAFIKRNEIKGYLDEEFYRMLNVWEKFNMGFGLPLSKSWADHPNFLIEIIETFEKEYRYIKG